MFIFCLHSGDEAQRVFSDAQTMLHNIINENSVQATGEVAFYRANSTEDDIQIYDSDNKKQVGTLYGLRQQVC